jgi:hypothetical protein
MMASIKEVIMRIFLALLLALGFGSSAFALGGGGGEGGGSSTSNSSNSNLVLNFTMPGAEIVEDDVEEGPDDPRVIILPTVVVPMSNNSRLTGFAFLQVRWRVGDSADIWAARGQAQFALDALVRTGYGNVLSNDTGTAIEHERAAEIWAETLVELFGDAWVDTVEVVGNDMRMVH